MFNQFRTQYLATAAESLKQWLASHNLPRWSVPVAWAVAVVPVIAVAKFEIPLPTVLLLNVSGFVGLLWLIQDSSVNSTQLPEDSSDLEPADKLLKQEINSESESSLDEPDSVISEENFQDNLDEDDSDESSLDEAASIADKEINRHFDEEERFAVVSRTYRD
jgi:hypothetical protein